MYFQISRSNLKMNLDLMYFRSNVKSYINLIKLQNDKLIKVQSNEVVGGPCMC